MKHETKVGLLFLFTCALIVFFVYVLGGLNIISGAKKIHLTYNFAGGIETGSPVRAMGIKVGKVHSISFDPDRKTDDGEEVRLVITVSISEDAWPTIREDSKFYINLAGVIGEKYIEISPGSSNSPLLVEGNFYRGIDPPRIDQLISQSYSLAGKILDMVEQNEGDVVSIINNIDTLVKSVNKTLDFLNQSGAGQYTNDFGSIMKNLNQISGDVAHVSGKLRTKEAEETMHLIYRLMWRLESLDQNAVKKFFQEEGIRARIF